MIVYAEDYGGYPNTPDCTVGLQAAIADLKANGGGVLQLRDGQYSFDSTLLVDFRGLKIRGYGTFLTTLRLTDHIHGFHVQGNLNGSGASYGFELRDLSFTHAAPAANAGSLIQMDAVHEMTLDNLCLLQYYQAIRMDNCQSPLTKTINNVSFVSPTGTNPVPGSSCVYFHGLQGVEGTGLTESVYMTNCRGGGTGTDFGVRMDGVDSIHIANSHFWGTQTAPLYIVSNGHKNIYNVRSTNNSWEAINGHAQYAAVISGNDITMHSIKSVGDQFFNGEQCAVLISGAATKAVTIATPDIVQAMNVGIRVLDGEKIKILGPTFIDGNLLGAGVSAHVEIGSATQAPNGVQVTDITASQEFFATVPKYGINVINGTAISIRGGLITDVDTILNSSVDPSQLSIEDFDSEHSPVVIPSNSTISVPLHYRRVRISGTNLVSTIEGAYKNRKLALRSNNGCTFVNGIGNILLNNNINWAAPGGSWLFLEYDPELAAWIEVGRRSQ